MEGCVIDEQENFRKCADEFNRPFVCVDKEIAGNIPENWEGAQCENNQNDKLNILYLTKENLTC